MGAPNKKLCDLPAPKGAARGFSLHKTGEKRLRAGREKLWRGGGDLLQRALRWGWLLVVTLCPEMGRRRCGFGSEVTPKGLWRCPKGSAWIINPSAPPSGWEVPHVPWLSHRLRTDLELKSSAVTAGEGRGGPSSSQPRRRGTGRRGGDGRDRGGRGLLRGGGQGLGGLSWAPLAVGSQRAFFRQASSEGLLSRV